MGGFIALTTQDWISSITDLTEEKAVFWRKRKTFKAICKGEPFYFLKRGHFETNNDRYIVGKALFCKLDVLPSVEAWKKYGCALGYENEKMFLDVVTKMYKERNPELGCLVLEKSECFQILFHWKRQRLIFHHILCPERKFQLPLVKQSIV